MKLVRTRIEMHRTFSSCRNSRQVSQAWELLIKKCGWSGAVSTNKARRRWDNICTMYNRYYNAKDGRLERAKIRSPYLALIGDYKASRSDAIPELDGVQEEILISNHPNDDSLNIDHDYLLSSHDRLTGETSSSATIDKSPSVRKEVRKKMNSSLATTSDHDPSGSMRDGHAIGINNELAERLISALEKQNQIHSKLLTCFERFLKTNHNIESPTPPPPPAPKAIENIRRTLVQPVYITAKPLRTYSKLSNQ